MAQIRRGKRKGQEVRLVQWCNDWFSVDPGGIVSPLNLVLTKEEIQAVKSHTNNGFMLRRFKLRDDGTFARIKR